MKKSFYFISLLLSLSFFFISCSNSSNPVNNTASISKNNTPSTTMLKGGFNQYGYNYGARIFNGTYNNYLAEKGDGPDAVYGNDNLIMKWNAEWDQGNLDGWTKPSYRGAWVDNEWNGKVPNGSGQIWHTKIIWVGPGAESSPYWVAGGSSIWGIFEVVMDQGMDPNVGTGHIWNTLTTPNGYK